MAIEEHCAGGNILTKGGRKAPIGIFGFSKRKVNIENKDNSYMDGIPIAWAGGGKLKGANF